MRPEDEILELEARLLAAWGSPTTAEIASLLAPDFGFWSLAGDRWDKAAFLRIMAAAPREGETRIESAEVRIFGDAAVYAARITDLVPGKDGVIETSTCVTDLFVRVDGSWRFVASHESLVTESP